MKITRRTFAACTSASLLYGAVAPWPVRLELGPEELVAPAVKWPYLFQGRDGVTAVLGLLAWTKGARSPAHKIVRSFDGRKTWQEWKPGAEHGRGPVTEGSVVQLRDGRILIFDVHAEHVGNKRFEAQFFTSKDGLRTLSAPTKYSFVLPEADVNGFDDMGQPMSRLYVRRSILELKNGDLLASAYGRFESDTFPAEYHPTMRKMRSFVLRSTDGGRTWSYITTIASAPVEQEGFGEPVFVQLQHGPRAGRLICLMRTGRENPIYQSESDDEGRTWTPAYPLRWIYSRFGRERDIAGTDPDLIEMQDGTLVMSYGHKPDYRDDGNYVAVSVDQGRTWTGVTQISSKMTVAYTGVREVSPGELFVVYTSTDGEDYGTAKFDTLGRSIRIRRT